MGQPGSERTDQQPIVGIDIGGTTMVAARVLSDGTIVDPVRVPSPASVSGAAVVAELRRLVHERWPGAARVGVGAAGVIDPASGTIVEASDSFRGWRGYPLQAELAAALGTDVRVVNDVNAFLLGEQRFGAAAGRADCLGIMLGTGVGGAVILGGELWCGARGAAAEIGHMPGSGDEDCTCGGVGHLETLAAGRMIARRFTAARGADAVGDASHVADAADGGDEVARRVFWEAGRALGVAMVQAATLYDLDTVVIGGGVTRAWRWIAPGLAESLERYPLVSGAVLRVVRSKLGEQAVLLGAASVGD